MIFETTFSDRVLCFAVSAVEFFSLFTCSYVYHVHTDLLRFVSSSPQRREDAVSPVIRGDVEAAEHLRRSDRLRVHPHLLVYGAAFGQRLHQHVDTARLAGAGRTQRHHAVTNQLSLVQLNQLQNPRSVRNQTELTHLQNAMPINPLLSRKQNPDRKFPDLLIKQAMPITQLRCNIKPVTI